MSNIVDDFQGRAVVYRAENCNDLPVLRSTDTFGNPVCVSCWQFTPEQLAEINANEGKVYLYIWGGGQPPVSLDHINPLLRMGTVEAIQAELNAMVDNIKELASQAKDAVMCNASAERMQELSNAIDKQQYWINSLSWVLNLKEG